MEKVKGPEQFPRSEIHSGKSIVHSILQSVIEEPKEMVLVRHREDFERQHHGVPDETMDAFDYSHEDYEI